mmetsp:Transcript_51596/g.122776  ORF Transcript_51596/g.122776 Transcript_51596/m.122776 type:complete len:425 (+) Transcript_51596:139-1413(+)|eukprot:CAMPEP_0178386200 /NCGR_PEP_ID=MMETSP0689_2-20121128/8437_1 /TAXON_ID=160604 /ORGANISM="Amphidinium massartii, Strain CS-259" /LENGTH=424 /DNA_ID=CAMNT_0020006529 /DNA_START=127 /DNA_END=1401 /DNA_ORIENTATION=-
MLGLSAVVVVLMLHAARLAQATEPTCALLSSSGECIDGDDEEHLRHVLMQVEMQLTSAGVPKPMPRLVGSKQLAEVAIAGGGFAEAKNLKAQSPGDIGSGSVDELVSALPMYSLVQGESVVSSHSNTDQPLGSTSIILLIILIILLVTVIMCFWVNRHRSSSGRGAGPEKPESSVSLGSKPEPGVSLLTGQPRNQLGMPTSAQGLEALKAPPGSGVSILARVESGGPPPICPSLILPHTEARFQIALPSLRGSTGQVDILGTSGRKLLHATAAPKDDRRMQLAVASIGCEDDPRTVIIADMLPTPDNPDIMEVYSRGGELYGSLLYTEERLYLRHAASRDAIVMVVEIEDLSEMRMIAHAGESQLLATAGTRLQVGGRSPENVETLKLQVKPAADAVLIMSCMLAKILLRGDRRPMPSAPLPSS